MGFGDRLRKSRISSRMTQQELATAANVSRKAIANYESGARTPPVDIAQRLAAAVGVSVDFLLGKTNNNIAQLRNEKGMSQQELADALGITLDLLVDIETGKKPIPNLRTMGDIGGVLGAGFQDVMSEQTLQDLRTLAANFNYEEAKEKMKKELLLLEATENYLNVLHDVGLTSTRFDVNAFHVDWAKEIGRMVVIFCEGLFAERRQIDISSAITMDEPK